MGSDAVDKCLQAARGKLKRSVLSEAQLREKLLAGGFDAAVVEPALDQLRRSGALNDEALGRAVMEELRRRKGAGPRLVELKLRQRGLEESLVNRLLREFGNAEDEIDQAEALARETLPTLRGDAPSRMRKLYAKLARRGYEQDVVEEALQRIEELRGTDVDESPMTNQDE